MRPLDFRQTTSILLGTLVVLSVLVLSAAVIEYNRRASERTQALIVQVQRDLDAAEQARRHATRVAARALRLEARRLLLSDRLEVCVILRLEGQQVPRCRQVRAKARELAVIIREFRQDLREQRDPRPPPANGGTVTQTRTATRTQTRTVAPPQGCPMPNPNNPNC